jgi:hypothetical protein
MLLKFKKFILIQRIKVKCHENVSCKSVVTALSIVHFPTCCHLTSVWWTCRIQYTITNVSTLLSRLDSLNTVSCYFIFWTPQIISFVLASDLKCLIEFGFSSSNVGGSPASFDLPCNLCSGSVIRIFASGSLVLRRLSVIKDRMRSIFFCYLFGSRLGVTSLDWGIGTWST